jgi:hypothetical protein
LQHRLKSGFHHGRESDHIDTLRNEGSNGFDLVFLLLLRV